MDFYEQIKEQTSFGLSKIDEVFNPLISVIEMKIFRLQEAKQDTKHYFDVEENEFVNYEELLNEYKQGKDEATKEFLVHIDKLIKEYEGNAAAAQQEEESGQESELPKIIYLIITQILKKGVKIKIGDVSWDSKKPLGGEGSVFNEIRDSALNAIGIDPKSDIGKLITDPVNGLKNIGQNTGKELEKALENTKRETEKTIQNIERETSNAIANVKAEADKVLKNVVREIAKATPRIKIKIKKPKIKW